MGLCHFDLDLRYVHVNEWLATLNGLAVSAHLGRTVGEVLPDVARGVEEQLRHVITTGETVEAEIVGEQTPAHSGIMKRLQYNFFPVRSPDGTVVGVSCAVQDVTGSVAALEVANEELEAFSDALAHDLKNPLLIVTNFSEILAETFGDALDEEEADHLQRIWSAGRHMMYLLGRRLS